MNNESPLGKVTTDATAFSESLNQLGNSASDATAAMEEFASAVNHLHEEEEQNAKNGAFLAKLFIIAFFVLAVLAIIAATASKLGV